MKKIPVVCCDRDGTINVDDNYYLGSDLNWRKQIEFLPGVIEGIKFIKKQRIGFYIVTNQAGVALSDPQFSRLTLSRMYEVNACISNLLRDMGAIIDGHIACPYVDSAYERKSRSRGRKVNPDFVIDNHPDLKPNTGMIEKAISKYGYTLARCQIYMVGDRDTDVQMGLNANGMGILVPSSKTRERGDVDKVERLARKNPGKVYVASDFLDASRYIIQHQESN